MFANRPLPKFLAQGDTISIEIPSSSLSSSSSSSAHQQQPPQQQGHVSWAQAMDMSPMDTTRCDSPSFSNFMLTLSPIMQLASPQPTVSPREQPQPMSPINEGEEMSFAFIGGITDAVSMMNVVEDDSSPLPSDQRRAPAAPVNENLTTDMEGGNDENVKAAANVNNPTPQRKAPSSHRSSASSSPLKPLKSQPLPSAKTSHHNTTARHSSASLSTGSVHPNAPSVSSSSSSSSSSHVPNSITAAGRTGIPAFVNVAKKCNCRKSRCLKLYCECFAGGQYCHDECGCLDCNNTKTFEDVRNKAVQSILVRNPSAFTDKIQYVEDAEEGSSSVQATPSHVRGCHCRKSFCIKKYCECFFAGVYCGDNCKCEGCKNYDGSEALEHSRSSAASVRGAVNPSHPAQAMSV